MCVCVAYLFMRLIFKIIYAGFKLLINFFGISLFLCVLFLHESKKNENKGCLGIYINIYFMKLKILTLN